MLTIGLLILLLLVLIAAIVSADGENWDDVELVEMGKWKDPADLGAIEQIDQSWDGDKLAVLYGSSPNVLRVTDRDLETLAVLETTPESAVIKGVRWSETDEWVFAWGSADGVDGDLLWFWNGTTFEPSDWLFVNFTTPLKGIDSAFMMAGDELLALAGVDENDSYRILIIETLTSSIRRDFLWEENGTVLILGSDVMNLVALDERGIVAAITGPDWTVLEDMGGHEEAPSADTFGFKERMPWMVGYQDGSVAIWGGNPLVHERTADFGDSPIQGISWAMTDFNHYYLVAVPSPSGGSVLRAYFYDVDEDPDNPASIPVEYTSSITYMVADIATAGQAWIGFDDGTVRLMNVSIIYNLIPELTIEIPEYKIEYGKDFTATGLIIDDLDTVEYVRVRYNEENWTDAVMSGDRWTFDVDVSTLSSGEIIFKIQAFDGKHLASNITFFQVPDKDDDDDGKWRSRVPWILLNIVIISIIVVFIWRWKKGKKEEVPVEQPSPPSDV